MWTWVSLVARVLPDWALQSLDVIIHDPGFNPKDLTNPLLNLRSLEKGPLSLVPHVKVTRHDIQGDKNPVFVANICDIVKQFFGIPQV